MNVGRFGNDRRAFAFTIAHVVDRTGHEGPLHHGPSPVMRIVAYRR